MASSETVLLKSTLEIQTKPYSVKLTSSEIYWEAITTERASGGPYSEPLVKTENQAVNLNEIIAVRLGSETAEYESKGGKFRNLEMVSLSPTMFSLWMVRRCQKHKWRDRKVTFTSKDASVIQQWVEKVEDILKKPEFNRPRSLVVFINPVGGKGLATRTYQSKVAPLFDLANISTDVITTLRQNHARDTLMDYDLSKVDGVVCVGGDGMFTEVTHGLLNRTLRSHTNNAHPAATTPLIDPGVRVGIIPAGSTDTVAYSLHGESDVITAALHIIVGDQMSMDVAAVFRGNQFIKYNVSLMGYGYFGDIILDSERNRWLGPKRYDWEGFKKVMGHRVYEGEVSFVPSADKENHPRDGSSCKAGCTTCQSVQADLPEPASQCGGDTPKAAAEKVQHIKGRFIAVNAFLISCRCRFSPDGPAPSAHIGDGCSDLVLVHECSRTDFAKFLFRCMKKQLDQFDFPFVQTFRVKEFSFRPLVDEIDDTHDASDAKIDGQQRLRSRVSHNSVWNCDGELVDEPAIDYKVYRKVLRLFGRGVEDSVKTTKSTCMTCLNG